MSATGRAKVFDVERAHGVSGNLIGRDGELRLLASAVEQAATGKTRAVVVLGEAGAGKTAVLNTAAAAAHEARVITVTGNEFSTRPFAVLADVLAATGGLRIERSAQTALEAAVGRSGAASTTDVMTAAVALFGELAAGGLTLLLVDDLHWLDNASVDVLRYVFNRLEADRLMLLASVRTPERNPLDDLNRLTIIDLAPLDRPSAVTILERAAVGVVTGVADRLHEQSGGNPLALLTAARLLTPEQRRGSSPLPDPIPVGLRLTESFAGEYAGLPEATRQALVLLAAGSAVDVDVLAAALASRGLSVDDLGAAVVAGFVTDSPPRFTHPLRRSAAYHGASSSERQAAHAAILVALGDAADAIERAHHLIGAANGPDDEAATFVLGASMVAIGRGAPQDAAKLAETASRLAISTHARIQADMAAAMSYWLSTDFDAAARIATALAETPSVPTSVRDTARHMAGVCQPWVTGPSRAADLLEIAAAETDDGNALKCQLAATAGLMSFFVPDLSRSARNAAWAADLNPGVGIPAQLALLMPAIAYGMQHGLRTRRAELASLRRWASGINTTLQEVMTNPEDNPWVTTGYIGMLHMVDEQWQASEWLLRHPFEFAGDAQLPAYFVDISVWFGEDVLRRGRLHDAIAMLVRMIDNPTARAHDTAAWPRAVVARAEFMIGNDSAGSAHAEQSSNFGRRHHFGLVIAWAAHAIALGHLGHGDYEAAFEASSETASVMDPSGLRHPGLLWWEADHIEAMIATGRGSAASERIDSMVRRSIECDVRVPRAQALRCQALLSTVDDARRAIAEGLALLDAGESDIPFERARLHLAFAERADAGRETALARAQAQQAAEIFVRLGANPWLDRCRAITDIEAATTLGALLTEAELRVALVIGAGATNKQAAKQLYLSVKTVEYHLSNIYRKLDIRTRTQLARMTTYRV